MRLPAPMYSRGVQDTKMEIRVGNRTMRAVDALLVLGVTTLMGQDSPQPPDWRDWIKQGTEAFRYARYSEAVSAFQKASDSNPKSPVPHLYLALGWFQQYIPNAVSADNADRARRAETELRRALTLDPMSRIAVVMLGQLAFYEGRLEEARKWYRKALAAEPRNADIWCTLGTIAQQQWLRQGKPAHQPILDEAIVGFRESRCTRSCSRSCHAVSEPAASRACRNARWRRREAPGPGRGRPVAGEVGRRPGRKGSGSDCTDR